MKFTLFTAVLFSVWMNAADGQDRPGSACCLTVTNTRIHNENIVNYTIQHSSGVCAIRAVRFLTRKGIYICSDPDDRWTIRAINDVNKRKNKGPCKKTQPTTCFTSTTNMNPTTTHETPETETETSTSSTEPPKVMRIETSRLETETSDHPDCCLTVTNTRTDEVIVDYHIQDSSLCPIRAVRFITVENNTICSSPTEDWVQDYIQNLNRKTSTDTLQLDGLSEESLTSEINDPYSNNNEYFCLKKEPVQYFCIKQP